MFFFSLWNCIDPYLRVSKKAAALSVIILYNSLSRMSSATTCQCIYAVVPKCFHQKQGPGDQLQALSARLQTSLCRSRFSRQSIRRPSPIKDRYFLLRWSVPFHCHLSSVKWWAHFHRDGSLGAWSCLCDIIAQMFDKVNLTPVPKWVWERNCKKYFHFSRYIGNLSNQRASLLSTYKDAFKNTICSTWAKIF